jgi:cyclophilin family peptidyl-prolyl cis-trans isomerase/HEAT repeat protein
MRSSSWTRLVVPGYAVLGLLWVALLLGCQSTAPNSLAPSPIGEPSMTVTQLDERALLMLLVDREVYESFSVNKALEGGDGLRLELARVLGVIALPEGRVVLERLLDDDDPAVRRQAAFGLGEVNEPLSHGVLMQMVSHADLETGLLAVEALDESQRRARLVPFLFRFEAQETMLLAARWLQSGDAQERAWAAYSLGRNAIEDAAPWLLDLLTDTDPWIRSWAARGLGSVGKGADLALLRPLLDDPEEGPRVQALRAAARLILADKVAAPESWKPALMILAEDSRPGVRLAALAAAEAWLPDPDLAALLIERGESGSPRERQIALLALTRGGDPRAGELIRRAAASIDLQLRRCAAQAAGILGDETLLALLSSDEHPAVRADVFEALLSRDDAAEMQFAEAALVDSSAAVRLAALRWLEEHPILPIETLGRALAPVEDDDRTDLEAGVVRALAALAVEEGSRVDEIAVVLDSLARGQSFVVRRAAAAALAELGVEVPAAGTANRMRDLAAYREIVQRTSGPRRVDLITPRGTIRLRLDCPQAPLTCLSFLQLAEQGFFDGLPFHRVVPDFVVQGGDPSGGGWGGPGYSLRDEINTIRFEAGVIGMAHGGPDTGGSQFFITLSPQPHLDGGYTAFGHVESGWEVLMVLQQEDEILQIREVARGAL